jgi:hypothetical protein
MIAIRRSPSAPGPASDVFIEEEGFDREKSPRCALKRGKKITDVGKKRRLTFITVERTFRENVHSFTGLPVESAPDNA